MRPIWKGAITFGLISIPVKLYGATEDKTVHFHLLHEKDGERVHNKRVCNKGHEVEWDDLVRGYEYSKGKYVVFTDDELDAAGVDSVKAVDIDSFVAYDEIDPMYFNKSYYVVPDSGGEKAYRLLAHALEDTGQIAIGKITLREKEHLATLRLSDGVFVLETMHWPDEIRAPKFDELKSTPRLNDNEKKMARNLVEQLSGAFEPERFKDEYRGAIKKLAKKKVEGKEITVSEEPEEQPAGVVDLMEALKQSVEAAKKGAASGRKKATKTTRKKASKKKTTKATKSRKKAS
ncbi:MAG TPA: Ku protein [Actinomycetota bacterium]|jgi:DNA end-binding protein Ku